MALQFLGKVWTVVLTLVSVVVLSVTLLATRGLFSATRLSMAFGMWEKRRLI